MTTAGYQFQLFDLLPEDEFSALKADIAKRGVLVPVEYDQDGNILDGHHRRRACDELGIKDFPTVVRRFATEEEKEEHVVTLNVRRRHLNGEQKRKWAEWFLRRHPEWSNSRVATEVGLTHPTIAKVREELESAGAVEKVTTRVGKDGKAQKSEKAKPTPQPSIFTSASKTERAQSALTNLGDEAPAKQLDLKRAERAAREAEAERKRAEPIETVTVVADIDLRHGDFRQILADIMPGTVDAIITDPPYPGEFVSLFVDLSQLAARILKPSGVLAVMCGQYYLPEYIASLGDSMRYRWCGAYIAQGARTRVHAAKVGTGWKPILIYQQRDAPRDGLAFLLDDLFDDAAQSSDGVEKEFHHWGQSVPGTVELVDRLSKPGDLVVDPFLGGGTTAVACKQLGRRFIGCDVDPAAVATSRERVA